MKRIAFLFCLFFCLSLTAQEKKDIVLKTEVSDVTVFIKGAQITRKTSANFPAGRSIVRITGISPFIDSQSVQFKADGEITVLSVNYQLNYSDSLKQSVESEQLFKQLKELGEKIKVENTNKEIISEELAFIRENKKIGGAEGVNIVNLKAASVYYGERISELKMKELETEKKIKKLSDEKNSLDRRLSTAGNTKIEPSGEVLLQVECKSAVRIPIELSYFVNNAGWYPSYDIRAKSISEPIGLVYKANIIQQTKEDWKNVQMKISSVNPGLGNVIPKLRTYYLDYYSRPPRYDGNDLSNLVRGTIVDTSGESLIGVSITIKGSTIGTVTDMDGKFSLAIPSEGGELTFSYVGMKTQTRPISNGYMHIVMEEDEKVLNEVVVVGYGVQQKFLSDSLAERASVIQVRGSSSIQEKSKAFPVPVEQAENQTSVEFNIQTPYTILSGNKNTTVEMAHYSIPASYEYYCIPKIDKDAFLLANIPDWEQYNLLEGEANIFFENTYIGKTILDVRYSSDTLNISLGRDKNVSVQREKIKEYTSQKFLASKSESTRGWKISVKNNKSQPISMVLFDQIPVSTVQEIEVSPENLSGAVLNKETGEMKWKFEVQPLKKNEFELKYKVKYPKGRTLTIE